MKFDIGGFVQVVPPVIHGKIVDANLDKEAKEVLYLVDYVGADGEAHSGWMKESQLAKAEGIQGFEEAVAKLRGIDLSEGATK